MPTSGSTSCLVERCGNSRIPRMTQTVADQSHRTRMLTLRLRPSRPPRRASIGPLSMRFEKATHRGGPGNARDGTASLRAIISSAPGPARNETSLGGASVARPVGETRLRRTRSITHKSPSRSGGPGSEADDASPKPRPDLPVDRTADHASGRQQDQRHQTSGSEHRSLRGLFPAATIGAAREGTHHSPAAEALVYGDGWP